MTADPTPHSPSPEPASSGIERVPTMAFGVQGCLVAAVSIFVIIILATILILFLRMSAGGADPSRPAARAEVVNIRQPPVLVPAVTAASSGQKSSESPAT